MDAYRHCPWSCRCGKWRNEDHQVMVSIMEQLTELPSDPLSRSILDDVPLRLLWSNEICKVLGEECRGELLYHFCMNCDIEFLKRHFYGHNGWNCPVPTCAFINQD